MKKSAVTVLYMFQLELSTSEHLFNICCEQQTSSKAWIWWRDLWQGSSLSTRTHQHFCSLMDDGSGFLVSVLYGDEFTHRHVSSSGRPDVLSTISVLSCLSASHQLGVASPLPLWQIHSGDCCLSKLVLVPLCETIYY